MTDIVNHGGWAKNGLGEWTSSSILSSLYTKYNNSSVKGQCINTKFIIIIDYMTMSLKAEEFSRVQVS